MAAQLASIRHAGGGGGGVVVADGGPRRSSVADAVRARAARLHVEWRRLRRHRRASRCTRQAARCCARRGEEGEARDELRVEVSDKALKQLGKAQEEQRQAHRQGGDAGSMIERNLRSRQQRQAGRMVDEKQKDANVDAAIGASQSSHSTEEEELRSKVVATVEAAREILPFSISELFYDAEGRSLRAEREEQLVQRLYFKDHFRRPSVALDEAALLKHVFNDSPFVAEAPVPCQQGLMFYGYLQANLHPSAVYSELQRRLDLHFPGLVAILGRDDLTRTAVGCLVAPREELLSFSLPRPLFAATSSLLSAASAYACYHAITPTHASQALLVPLGLLAVLGGGLLARMLAAKVHNVLPSLDYPIPLPTALHGALGMVVPYKGYLPNRATLMDLSLASCFGSAAISGLLLLLGNAQTLHLPLLTWMAGHLSQAVYNDHNFLVMAIGPYSLAGLLGLQFTALNLIPLGILDGGRLVTAISGRRSQHLVSNVSLVAMTLSLLAKRRWEGALWMCYMLACAKKDDWFQWEEVSEPGKLRVTLALVSLFSALGILLPCH
eukprot:SM000042S15373  [mRNA]  locus=s42:623983:627229:+ [translate_table: standard]